MALFREELDPEIDPPFVSRILIREQSVIEGELIPVVQSIVNKEIRDMQSHGDKYFAPIVVMYSSDLKKAASTLVNKINFESSGQEDTPLETESDKHICLAAVSCLKTVRPLLNYWVHLPQHRDYLVTIIERLLSGFVSSSRQELETIDWRMLSTEKKYRIPIIEAIKSDPLFTHYRGIVYEGKLTVDDLMIQRSGQETPRKLSMSTISSILSKGHALSSAVCAEIDIWGSLWDVTSSAYPVTNENICHDFQKIQIIAAIAYGSDWLCNKFSNRFLSTARRSSSSIVVTNVNNNLTSTLTKAPSSSNRQEELAPLRHAFQAGLKELSKLSEEGIALLRGELQLACFHYLHLISKLDLSMIAAKTGGSAGEADGRPEPEALIGAWNQYMLSFQDAILLAAHPSLLGVVFSPLCYLAPRLLMRCIKGLFDSSTRLIADGVEGKTKLLRSVVACQQGLSMLFESSRLDPAANRALQDRLTDEFSRIRRFVQLIGCQASELRLCIAHNAREYSKDQCKTLWLQTKDRAAHEVLQDFEVFWSGATKVASSNPIVVTTAQRSGSPV